MADRVALVTGASRGLGRDIALRLGRDGFATVLNYREQAKAADEVARTIAADGGRAIAVRADVAEPAGAQALFDAAERVFGGVDVLVNNAGLSILAPLAEMDDLVFDQHFAVNVRGVFNMLKRAATRLRPGGRVVNLSSTAVAGNRSGYGAYVASKAAVEALTRTFANELRGRSITVNAVAPGLVGAGMFLATRSAEQLAAMAQISPLERLADPAEIAGVVAFLVGSDGGWVNGQILRANGGAA
ncbi:MAG TPA: SDR family oxidoreductase [Xanthobacteraceae bacterium]